MSKVAVVTFGRMNPVTVGHEKLARLLRQLATERGGDALVYLSRSYDGLGSGVERKSIRNPLSHGEKVSFVEDALGHLVTVVPEEHRDIFSVLPTLQAKGYTDVVLVGDEAFLAVNAEKYNGTTYSFSSITTVHSGYRSPTSKDPLESVSATLVREAVVAGNYEAFTTMVSTKRETHRLWTRLREELVGTPA